jgi:hypothetical protein
VVDSQSPKNICNLRLHLDRFGSLQTSYESKVGLKRDMTLRGLVDDPGHDFRNASAFHRKACELSLSSPVDQEWLKEIRNSLGDGDICGEVIVYPGLVPDRFEAEGETYEIGPVEVTISVSNEAFEAFQHQVVEALGQHRVIGVKLWLSGGALPDKESGIIFLDDLDISDTQKYSVTRFEMTSRKDT